MQNSSLQLSEIVAVVHPANGEADPDHPDPFHVRIAVFDPSLAVSVEGSSTPGQQQFVTVGGGSSSRNRQQQPPPISIPSEATEQTQSNAASVVVQVVTPSIVQHSATFH